MLLEELKQNVTVYGPLFPEPVEVIIAIPMGASVKLIGKGIRKRLVNRGRGRFDVRSADLLKFGQEKSPVASCGEAIRSAG